MKFTDKLTQNLTDQFNETFIDIRRDIQKTTEDLQAVAAAGMLAFVLVATVAITALVIATKKG
jgi:hypothetical protein